MQQTRGGVAGLARAMAAALGVAAPGVAAPLGTGAAPEARGASAAPEPAALLVRVHPGPQRFLIDEPDAAESAAARANSDQLPGPGGALPAPTPGYVLTSRVIVRGADVPGLVAEAQRAGAGIEVFAPVTGYHVATLPSVRTAAGFAEALVAGGVAAEAYVDVRPPQPLRDLPTDPGFASQWHLHNLLVPAADVNAAGAWDLGLTGAGVTIGIVEDGWAVAHPDLALNYAAAASQAGTAWTSHGSSVAGLAGARANNAQGGAGLAYLAQLSRLYRGTALANATAFTFANDLNDVKNNSWGPADNGRISYMTPLERDALAEAVATGRGGLGEVFVWAAGNGGQASDRVEYDPYASSRYVIAVGGLDDDDDRGGYSEPGAALLVCAHSSGNGAPNRWVYTTAGTNSYTTTFGYTSAAAPLAAGAVALMLQARPMLTWRDVQHVLVNSARRHNPDNPGWQTNGAGRWVSYDSGFGAIDAGAAVLLAQTWGLVGPEAVNDSGLLVADVPLPDNVPAGVEVAHGVVGAGLVEHVEVELTAAHARIGDLRVELVSPSGFTSVLAEPRNDPTVNYTAYVFTTARHWDEPAAGTWTLRVSDRTAGTTGTLNSWRLRVYSRPVPCPADFDGSGTVGTADLTAFLAAWFNDLADGTREADFNASGQTTTADITAFLGAWFAAAAGGC